MTSEELMRNTEHPKQISKSIQVSSEKIFSGLLPQPEDLEKYDRIVPGAAERIIAMAERELKHRHAIDKRMTGGVIYTTKVSILFAFLSVIVLSAICFYAIHEGYPTVAGTIAGFDCHGCGSVPFQVH